MAFESIQIFACDHRKNVQWDLPYIRLGSKNSDSSINIKNDDEIAFFDPILSEGAQILYIAKHIREFGDPSYVGIVHYRRFFSFVINQWILNISNNDFYPNYCALPYQILSIIQQNNADGIAIHPIPILSKDSYKFIDIVDQLAYIMQDGLNCPKQIVNDAFDIFLSNSENLADEIRKTFKNELQYVCNIFILKSSLFKQYADIIFKTSKQIMSIISEDQIKKMHPRFLGFILERFTSCYLYAIQNLGSKILHVPVLTVDAHIHQDWKPNPKDII